MGAEVGRLGLGGGDDGSSFRGRKCVGWDRDDLSNVGMKVGGDQPRQTNGAQNQMDETAAVSLTSHVD
jgi:hypothetical protein